MADKAKVQNARQKKGKSSGSSSLKDKSNLAKIGLLAGLVVVLVVVVVVMYGPGGDEKKRRGGNPPVAEAPVPAPAPTPAPAPQDGQPPEQDPSEVDGSDGDPTNQEHEGEPGYESDEQAGPDEQPKRPEDVAKWKGQDFYDARDEGDPLLIEAVGQLARRAPGSVDVAENLAKLLEPPAVEEGADQGTRSPYGSQPGGHDPKLTEALVAALGANGSDLARTMLGQLLAGTLATQDDKTAVDAALKALVDHPSAENEEILFGVLTAAEKLRPQPKGEIGADQLREKTLVLVSSTASDRFRSKLAGYLIQPATPPALRTRMGEFLGQNHPDNVGAQLILLQSDATAQETRATIEQYFTGYSSAAMAHALGIAAGQPGEPAAGAAGSSPAGAGEYDGYRQRPGAAAAGFPGGQPGLPGAEKPQETPADPDAPYRRARQLWSPQTVAMVEGRLAELTSLAEQTQLALLAGTIPADSMRSALWETLQQHWSEGPQQLEAAGLASSLITDPGLLVTIKTLPRRTETDPRSAPRGTSGGGYRPSNYGQRGDSRQPGSAVETAQEAVEKRMQAERDWMKASERLVRAWCDRFHAAGLARAQAATAAGGNAPQDDAVPPAAGDAVPPAAGEAVPPAAGEAVPPAAGEAMPKLSIELHKGASVVSEYHMVWPGELGARLSGIAPGPMEIHYVRIVEKANHVNRLGYYYRKLGLKSSDIRAADNGAWLDRLIRVPKTKVGGPVDKTGWRRSLDVLVSFVQENAEPARGEETDLVIQILSIEMKNPEKS